jgi:hypothetical protein
MEVIRQGHIQKAINDLKVEHASIMEYANKFRRLLRETNMSFKDKEDIDKELLAIFDYIEIAYQKKVDYFKQSQEKTGNI